MDGGETMRELPSKRYCDPQMNECMPGVVNGAQNLECTLGMLADAIVFFSLKLGVVCVDENQGVSFLC